MIKIKEIDDSIKPEANEFSEKEWKRFNNEKGFDWDKKNHSFVAYNGDSMGGFLRMSLNGGAAYLNELLVAKEERNKKIGKNLLKKFEEFARNNGCHVAYLKTSEKHNEALEFHKKHGYKISAKLEKHEFGWHWYFLTKELGK